MKTIDRILKEAGYTKKQLIDCEIKGTCNGMGAKGGIQWTDQMRKLKYFNSKEEKELLTDLDYVSDIHDIDFAEGGTYLDFIKANYRLSIRIIELLHWSTVTGRLLVFILVFFGTSIFGIRTFNFHK